MTEWWYDDIGRNTLSGIPGDPENPAVLPDDMILSFLLTAPASRDSFERLVPTMSPAEQERLGRIALMASNGLVLDPMDASARFERAINTQGIRRGGGWIPPPFEEAG